MKVLAPPSPASLPALRVNRPKTARLDSLATLAVVALALTFGLGDIAQTNAVTSVVLTLVRALLPLAIGLSVVAAVAARRWPSFPSSLAVPVAVWLAVLVASAALAQSHRAEAMISLARPTSGALLAWAVTDVCRRRSTWQRLLRAVALGGLAIAAIALAEASGQPTLHQLLDALHDGSVPIGDVPRVAASLSHPNEAAVLLELTLPLLIAWAWSTSRRRPALLAAAAATLLALVLTFSRAGILAALVALAVVAVAAGLRRDRGRLLSLAGIVMVVPVALGWAAVVDPGLDRRLLAGLDESSSIQPPRTEFWGVALEMARDRPLLGVGPDNFRWLFADYSGVAEDNLGIHAHDQYLETLANTGALGLMSLIWLLGALWRGALQRLRATAIHRRGVDRPGLDRRGDGWVSDDGPGVEWAGDDRPGVEWPSVDWAWRAALLASLSAWLVHAVLDDFERFWPTSVVFWLLAGLSLSRARASVD